MLRRGVPSRVLPSCTTASRSLLTRSLSSSSASSSTSFVYPGEIEKKSSKSSRRILVTGSSGQIGQELVPHLREVFGRSNVISSDVRPPSQQLLGSSLNGARSAAAYERDLNFVYADVTDADNLARVVLEYGVDTIVHMASMLSAVGERNPQMAIRINSRGIENVLEVARNQNCSVLAPSTIAVFGPTTPNLETPDDTIMRPTTVYGVTKVYLELLGEYYHSKYDLDFRSMRYPGIISNKTLPGGGTTDYAVDIFYEAVRKKSYKSFLQADTMLPMMYMPDALKATVALIEAPNESLKRRTFNITAMSFTPAELAASIQKEIPEFTITYEPDFRQNIANSWPRSLDDNHAREDWGWKPEFDLDAMTRDMLAAVRKKLNA